MRRTQNSPGPLGKARVPHGLVELSKREIFWLALIVLKKDHSRVRWKKLQVCHKSKKRQRAQLMLRLRKSKNCISLSKNWPRLKLLKQPTKRVRKSIRAKLFPIPYPKLSQSKLANQRKKIRWELRNWSNNKLRNRRMQSKIARRWNKTRMYWITGTTSIIRNSHLRKWKINNFKKTSSKSRRKMPRRRSKKKNSRKSRNKLLKTLQILMIQMLNISKVKRPWVM